MDLNPFLPIGIDTTTCQFLDTFLIWCLLAESPHDSPDESARMQRNQLAVVERGREPGLNLATEQGEVGMSHWGQGILDACEPIADLLDQAHSTNDYRSALAAQRAKLNDVALTPSAAVMAELAQAREPFFRFAMNQAMSHQAHFAQRPLAATEQAEFEQLRLESLAKQKTMEAADSLPFDD